MDGSIPRYLAFAKTAELGSFTKAAAALSYSQPGISRLVAELEAEWGVRLLERSCAGVSLTPEGVRLLPAARQICAAQEEFRAAVDDVKGLASGLIRIGTFSSVATHWLPRVIKAFQADYPGIDYELFLADYTEITDALVCGRVDCGFVRMPAHPALAAREVARDEMVAVLPEGHPLAQHASIALADLAAEPFLLLERDDNREISELFERAGIPLSPHFITWDDYAIMAMVEQGLGLAVLHRLIMQRVPYRVVTRPLAEPAYRTIAFATAKARAVPLAVQRFERYLTA